RCGAPVRIYGEVRHDSEAGNSVRDDQRSDSDWEARRVRFDSRGEICGFNCGGRRSDRGYPAVGACDFCHEGRRSLQTVIERRGSIEERFLAPLGMTDVLCGWLLGGELRLAHGRFSDNKEQDDAEENGRE